MHVMLLCLVLQEGNGECSLISFSNLHSLSLVFTTQKLLFCEFLNIPVATELPWTL